MRVFRRYIGHIALLIANIIFGLNMPVSRSLLPNQLSPLALNGLRITGAAVLFWTASMFVKKVKIPRQDIIRLFFAALLGVTFNQLTFLEGLSTTSPVTASLVTTLLPIMTMVLSAAILKEPVTWLKTIGIIVGGSGAVMLILNNADGSSGSSLKGILLILLSGLSYAFYLTLFKKLISRYHPVHIMKWLFLFSVLATFPIWLRPMTSVNLRAMSGPTLWKIGYVVVFATFVAYLMIPIGQKTIRPTTLSMYNYLQPVVASLVAVFVGMDKFGYENILSAILVFSGVYIVTQSKTKYQVELEKRRKNISNIRKAKDVT